MIIGVPKEIKAQESRIGAVPAMVHELVERGHRVLVEHDGGVEAGLTDAAYEEAGGEIAANAREVYEQAEMIVKVKEPLPEEYDLIREGQILFTYFHFAASRELTDAMVASGAHCFAYETLELNGSLPLLTPMSEVAGRMAIQVGAFHLERHQGGRGVLLGGVPGVSPATVLIIGGGTVGSNAAKMAAGLGAQVVILDLDLERLRYLDDTMPANVRTLFSTPYHIRQQLPRADLVVGAVLISGARAPVLVQRVDLALMKDDGPVIVDVAVDQGGCIETCKPTTHDDPTFVVDGVVHYCVANMPGAVPRTSTFALTNATTRYAARLADAGVAGAVRDPALRTAANVVAGKLTCQAVAEAFGLDWTEPEKAI